MRIRVLLLRITEANSKMESIRRMWWIWQASLNRRDWRTRLRANKHQAALRGLSSSAAVSRQHLCPYSRSQFLLFQSCVVDTVASLIFILKLLMTQFNLFKICNISGYLCLNPLFECIIYIQKNSPICKCTFSGF